MALRIIIPFKKTDEVNLEDFLNRFIREKYSDETMAEHKDSVKSLHALRSSALCKHTIKIDPNFDHIAQYYIQMKILEPIISSHEDQSFVRVTWYNTIQKGMFSSQGKFSLNKISFEKANVLHILGASAFQMGYRSSGDKDNDIKVMIKWFQLAAGIFTELKTILQNNDFSKALSDLNIDWADVFINAALAEAQQGFLKKILTEPNKDAQIVKLSYKISTYYKTALVSFSKVDSKSSWEKDMEKILTIKYYFYSALSHLHQSIVDQSQSNYGIRITNLIAAREKINECMKRYPNELTKNLEDRIVSSLEAANKENQLIYHANIPDINSLPEMTGLAIAKPLPLIPDNLLDGKKSSFNANFQNLVPVVVRNATNLFSSRLASLISQESLRIDEAQQIIDSLLAELNIPASLENSESNSLPSSLIEKASSIQGNGGFRSIEANLKLLDDLRARDVQVLAETRQILQREETEDNNYRTKYGSNWTRASSYDLNRSWRDVLSKFDEQITVAHNSDKILQSKFIEIKPDLEMLSQGHKQLAKLLSDKASMINKMGDAFKQELIIKYQKVVQLKKHREQLLKDLQINDKEIEKYFMKHLTNDGMLNIESECDNFINSLAPTIGKLKESIEHQSDLVNYFIDAIQKLNSQSTKPDNTLEKLFKSYDIYQSIRKGYSEGIEFYNKHVQQLLTQQTKINDFCCARSMEAKELVEMLIHSQQPQFQYINYQPFPQFTQPCYVNAPQLPRFIQNQPFSSNQPNYQENTYPPPQQYPQPPRRI